MGRRALLPLVAALVLITLPPGGPHLVVAATPELRVMADVSYEFLPDRPLIDVMVRGRVQNDGATTADHLEVDVLSGGGYRAFVRGVGSRAVVVRDDGFVTTLAVDLSPSLLPDRDLEFQISYVLRDGDALDSVVLRSVAATFPAWAAGSEPGGSVTITIPESFDLGVFPDDVPAGNAAGRGRTSYRWSDVDPLMFGYYATADLAVVSLDYFTLVSTTSTVGEVEVSISVRAWQEDAAWGRRVSDRLTRALPILSELIGMPYIGHDELAVRETTSRSIGGYAGVFQGNVVRDEIQIAFDATDAVTVHEAAHAWFDESISFQRWINEGFASYYAELAAIELDLDGEQVELTPDIEQFEIDLHAWGASGQEDEWTDLYGYGASLAAARQIAERAGQQGLADVWTAMADRDWAYQPFDPRAGAPPESWPSQSGDSTYFLDMLEERTGKEYGDIFVEWVFSEDESALLEERSGVRAEYARLREVLAGWAVPATLRRKLDGWQFASAAGDIRQAREALMLWSGASNAATTLGLASPRGVRDSFETGNLGEARSLAQRASDSLHAIGDATLAEAHGSALDWLGSFERNLSADLTAARGLYERGDYPAAAELAGQVAEARRGADEIGIVRLGFASSLLTAGAWAARRRRRRT